MIKKNIFLSICAGCIIFFVSCGSTPKPEPELEPPVIQPEPIVQQEVPAQPPVDVIPENVTAVQTERNAAIQAKSRADGIKAAVTEKDAYGEAEAVLAQAEDYLNAGEIDAARATYHSARETFEAVYAQVSQKRVQAAESIRLAALRSHEVESFAFEADAIELSDEDEYSEEMPL